ncbi:hypothetical protein LTR94_027497, partial [Friedmanniomyces endolithicus]
PIPDGSNLLPPTKPPLMREHRLYQADWLMRFYGFTAPEIGEGTDDGMLDLAVDPKLAWALRRREAFPVDVNRAAREALLRVPGLGVKAVDRILSVRRHRTLRLEDVGRLTRSIEAVRPWITALDWTPGGLTDAADLRARLAPRRKAEQLSLWREAARRLRLAGVEPAQARFVVGRSRGDLFDETAALPEVEGAFNAPRAFMETAAQLIQHRSENRFDLMYRLLWRLKDQPDLLNVLSDRDVAEAADRVKAVRRAAHKMKAFVRFRQAEDEAGEHWVAWFEPAHRVLQATAPFFARRFSAMRWTILTPDGSAHWHGETLTFGPAGEQAQAPAEDAVEDFWRTYYASTFNPARLR